MKFPAVKVLIISLLITSSLFILSTADSSPCGGKCNVRCSKAGRQDRCLKYCNICCEKCNYCVPSGTYGNKDECPCYRDMKNSKGTSKCP
ncbi:Gibberellin-regulated protein 10 [Arabidopsis thaliana]|uniref:Gibberellin-regulated protein 10 n=4 Tax=Arabidopsis TaxID=3701 RepID=GASAA_ARATH|nr:Gibberellin-regulated family protein [Arabidopsis thaliana]Q8LFM2.1 RecName: Full=Gibberellin-regulated protein 10; AltName: Full=GAST1 protein homolog 10; Flags: Precursor [Arabidopsis thaliana]KAG7606697.1 Gibberellin regulated protein [Arabidopsis thaliana x Arabidopsis arenosa]KAG7613606.1 Gibberellin regulated protein [Arabidopsis suecica]AAM61329.1 contains similarity to gibberellin-stimulated transcript 1 like protein [Arabidopsis thaliana]AED97241.1 Gibberellin-regulated family prot|eukprot:NP_568914.1 Gibberellin-regulated family protein [Arabidopsis thaliana]